MKKIDQETSDKLQKSLQVYNIVFTIFFSDASTNISK